MLSIGTIYRMPRPAQWGKSQVDGLPNYYYEAYTPGYGSFAFQRGIHVSGAVVGADGVSRIPVIIISSTPRKAGSEETPWRDRYDPDHGYVIYYGDNKEPGGDPAGKGRNNKALIELLQYYQCDDKEARAEHCVPVVFFEKVSYEGRPKGNAVFQGFGIVESAELVTQYNKDHEYFANYRFNFCVLSLAKENELFDWQWISDRCDPNKRMEETLDHAPESWKRFLAKGFEELHLLRRSVAGRGLVKKQDQLPGSNALLQQIYDYYTNTAHKHDFEYLAMEVTVKTVEETCEKCKPGWITKQSADGGIDFVLRADLGREALSSVNIIILGQAKCEKLTTPTNGLHIARTVARLKRGWVGAYVTTSYFSDAVQKEVKEDGYPIMLINGQKIASIVEKELYSSGLSIEEYLDSLTNKYSREMKIPENILDD